MTPFAVGTTVAVLAVIGLVVGLLILGIVIYLLQSTLTPLRKVLADVQDAKTAPMLERGVPGTDQLGQTRRLADSVPPLALAYLQKISGGMPAPAPVASAPAPAAAPWTPAAPAAPTAPEPPRPDSTLPAWKRYS